MNPTNYTPGPWRQTGVNVRAGDALICWVTDHYFNIETSNSEKFANARLIASAPELLRALELALSWLESAQADQPEDWQDNRLRDAVNSARAIISKAKGEA